MATSGMRRLVLYMPTELKEKLEKKIKDMEANGHKTDQSRFMCELLQSYLKHEQIQKQE